MIFFIRASPTFGVWAARGHLFPAIKHRFFPPKRVGRIISLASIKWNRHSAVMKQLIDRYKGFLIAILPASIGGWIWSACGLPLAWLMGAAILSGLIAFRGIHIILPPILYFPSLALIGAGVGLSVTPEVANMILKWFPLMAIMAFSGVILAAFAAPIVARLARIDLATSFFSLMPGGVIEMANIGEPFGADRTIITALHAVRVALVVGLLPMGLFALRANPDISFEIPASHGFETLLIIFLVALMGGWIGSKINLPASWLLGSLLLVSLLSISGLIEPGRIPPSVMALAQIIVGMSLGAKFERDKLARIPNALRIGIPALLGIIAMMAIFGVMLSKLLPFDEATMVLALSIGGLAEMVLTAQALEASVAIVAAFQATRAVLVNACAGMIWKALQRRF